MTSFVKQAPANSFLGSAGASRVVLGSLVVGALALVGCGGGSAGGLMNVGSGAGSGGAAAGSTGGTGVGGAGATSGGVTGTTGAPGSGTMVGSGTAVGTGTSSGGMGAGSGMIVGAPPSVCMAYCTSIMATCTGEALQYKDQADCMTACAFIPAGATGDTSDSIACRTANLAKAAAAGANSYPLCLQGGPDMQGACGDEHGTFCNLAVQYCPGSYTDATTCQNIASQLTEVTPTNLGTSPNAYTAGNYSAMGVAKADTFECRFYQLIAAMDGADAATQKANAAMYCPSVANVSPNCGPGVTVMMTMGAGDGGAGAIGSDAGTVASGPFNETGCTAGTAGCYPFATRRMILRDEGNPHLHLIDLGTPGNDWSTATDGAWARTAQLVGIPTGYTTPQVLGGRNDGYEYYDLATGKISHVVNTFANSMSPYRMKNGNTLLTLTGGTIKILDATDKQITSVTYPGHGYVRLGRPAPLRAGIFTGQTFLIPSDTTLFEGDLNGNIVKSITNGASGWGHIWLGLVRADGKVLLGTAFGSSVDVIDWSTAKPTVVSRYGSKAGTYATATTGEANPLCWSNPQQATCPALTAGAVKPNFFSEFQILPNGNIITPNWQGHGGGNGASGIQVLEFNAAGDVVWYYKQDPTVFSSIQGVLLLDGLDPTKLNVEDTDDGTWQAVE
jgi:hypothetical protein